MKNPVFSFISLRFELILIFLYFVVFIRFLFDFCVAFQFQCSEVTDRSVLLHLIAHNARSQTQTQIYYYYFSAIFCNKIHNIFLSINHVAYTRTIHSTAHAQIREPLNRYEKQWICSSFEIENYVFVELRWEFSKRQWIECVSDVLSTSWPVHLYWSCFFWK